jgi:hypothetical protein
MTSKPIDQRISDLLVAGDFETAQRILVKLAEIYPKRVIYLTPEADKALADAEAVAAAAKPNGR